MVKVFFSSWTLFMGLALLMVGNGLQGTLLGVRGSLEGYSASAMAYVMSAYFVGFLIGARITPGLIAKVGHVRVFAAFGSLISAAFILYAALPNPISWAILRLGVGICFCGVYVVTESWLNESATNETRGKALSLYLIVQMLGIIAAQMLLNLADPTDYTLFVVMSVLVSLAFLPILLSAAPAPVFQAIKPMSLVALFRVSPLGMVGTFLTGGVFAGMFGMAAVYATERGMSAAETSFFVALIYLGGLLMQYPIGAISDRMDRRLLILCVTAVGAAGTLLAYPFTDTVAAVYVAGFVMGGVANPLYALLIAYTNDYLDHSDMAAGSGGMLFANGLGAASGPFVIGWLMGGFGPDAFFLYIGGLFAAVSLYAAYRMTRRATGGAEVETTAYAAIMPQSSAVYVGMAQDYAVEQSEGAGHDADLAAARAARDGKTKDGTTAEDPASEDPAPRHPGPGGLAGAA